MGILYKYRYMDARRRILILIPDTYTNNYENITHVAQ